MQTQSVTQRDVYTLDEPHIRRSSDGVWHIHGYAEAREILLSEEVTQAGFKSEVASRIPGMKIRPVLWADGEEHHAQRRQVAKYFSPSTVQKRYAEIMEQYAREIIADFQRAGQANVRDMSARIAVSVAGDVVGLTESPRKGLYTRLDRLLHSDPNEGGGLKGFFKNIQTQWNMLLFYWRDVKPAIQARKANPQDDVISHMLSNNRSVSEIMAECVTYGAAGMVTTQEFIAVAAYHLLKNETLRQQFLAGEQAERYNLLHELLRLEPVVGMLHRRASADLNILSQGKPYCIPAGALIAIHVYDVNADARSVGEQPLQINPRREVEKRVSPSAMGFGAGPHRCAGEHIAITESDIFLRQLLAIDGLVIESEPRLGVFETGHAYEIQNFTIAIRKNKN